MNEVLSKKLFDDFPHLFRNRHESSMHRGFECGDGWFDLIYELSQDIETVAQEGGLSPDSPEWPVCRQVKQKLGSLRFTVFAVEGHEEVYECISELRLAALYRSFRICELCGRPGLGNYIDKENNTMCGYCTEHLALLAMQDSNYSGAPTDSRQTCLDVYLEGVRDLPNALRPLSMQTVSEPWVATIVLCRAIEILTLHGFESDAYQQLFRQHQFLTAIAASCTERAGAARDDVDNRLNIKLFAWLANIDTYLVPDCFEQHLSGQSTQACISLLVEYIDWWLVGGTVLRRDLLEVFDDTGILDPLDHITETERLLLDSRFPALCFALLHISGRPEGAEILWTIIVRCPAGVPDFNGLDLWLQRRAVLAYYDRHGLARFLTEVLSIRIELLQYLAAARPLQVGEKSALMAALTGREGAYCGTTDEWYWAGDPQL